MPTNSTEAAPRTGALAGTLVVVVAVVISLALAEVALRLFTPFPVGYASNKAADPDLGYRLSAEFPEADANGFRNPAGTGHVLLAIGDSHTYGNNVGRDATWPAVLGRTTGLATYNAGVGSYGILAYHALRAQQRGPDTRAAIVALYPGNDFAPVNSNCLIIKSPSPFWQAEAQRLGIEWPPLKKVCADVDEQQSLGEWLVGHSAIAGAADAVLRGERALPAGEPRYEFPDGVQPLLVERIRQHARSTDLDDPVVAAMLRNFARLAAGWAADGGPRTGVLILPTRQRVVYAHFERQGRLGELAPEFVSQLQGQLRLEAEVARVLTAAGIPFRNAVGDVVTAFDAELAAGRAFYPADDDGHPLEAGYAAYAAAAGALLADMGVQAAP